MKEQKSRIFEYFAMWNDKYPKPTRFALIIVFTVLLIAHVLCPKRIDILTVVLLCIICLGFLRRDFYDFFKNMKAVGLPNLGLVISDLEAEIKEVEEENNYNSTESYVENYNSVNEGVEKVTSGLRSSMIEILEILGEDINNKNNFESVLETFSTKITNKEKTLSLLRSYNVLMNNIFDFEQTNEIDFKKIIEKGFLLISILQSLKEQLEDIKSNNSFLPNIRYYKNEKNKKITLLIDLIQKARDRVPISSINKNSFSDEKGNILKGVYSKDSLNVCVILDNSTSMGIVHNGLSIMDKSKKNLEDMFIDLSNHYKNIKGNIITFDKDRPFNSYDNFRKSLGSIEAEYYGTPLVTSLIKVIKENTNNYDVIICLTDGESYGEDTESLILNLKDLLMKNEHPLLKVIAIGSNDKFETLQTISSWQINNIQIGFNIDIEDIKNMVNQIRQSLRYIFEIKIQNFKVVYIKIFNRKYKVYSK